MSGSTATCPPSAPAASSRWPWRLLGLACRFSLGGYFLLAAIGKVTDLHGFQDYLAVQAGLPPWLAFAVAAFLPWLELVCGLCLVAGWAVREAALLTALLLVVFIGYFLIHPVEAGCGCIVWPARFRPPTGRFWLVGSDVVLLACALRTVLPLPSPRSTGARGEIGLPPCSNPSGGLSRL